jgi:hypothetical protein
LKYVGASAELSHDGLYRYRLWRKWDADRPWLVVIGHNPSTADAYKDDHTIRRCVSLAARDGFGGLDMLNLYAYRATDPRELERVDDPVGWANGRAFEESCRHATHVVAAWGAGADPKRVEIVRAEANCILWCWGVTKDGSPRHPSRLSNTVSLVPWPL